MITHENPFMQTIYSSLLNVYMPTGTVCLRKKTQNPLVLKIETSYEPVELQ